MGAYRLAPPKEKAMSDPQPRHSHGEEAVHAPDGVEGIVHAMPIVLPLMGGVLMFLLAFIAIYMA